VVGRHEARVLGGLTAHEGAPGGLAARGDAADDLGDPLGHDLPAGDVVLEEQRLGAADDEVVDDHPDEVDADRVVLVDGLGDRELGADAVGAAGEQRPAPLLRVEAEQPGEAAQTADDLRPASTGHPRPHELDGSIAGVDVDPGRGVRRVAHGRTSASTSGASASSSPSTASMRSTVARPLCTTT
jgi:hypothetical protein